MIERNESANKNSSNERINESFRDLTRLKMNGKGSQVVAEFFPNSIRRFCSIKLFMNHPVWQKKRWNVACGQVEPTITVFVLLLVEHSSVSQFIKTGHKSMVLVYRSSFDDCRSQVKVFIKKKHNSQVAHK